MESFDIYTIAVIVVVVVAAAVVVVDVVVVVVVVVNVKRLHSKICIFFKVCLFLEKRHLLKSDLFVGFFF